MIGESDFFVGVQCLTLNKSMFVEDKDVLVNTNNFQIFMKIMSEKEAKDKKVSTQQVLALLFPEYKVLFTPRSLLFQKDGENLIIDDTNFENLQDILRLIFCSNSSNTQQAFNPANDAAREIAQKLMRGRERVAAQKNEGGNTSIFSQYLSILTVGLQSMSLQNLMDLTMFQLYDLVERYHLYINWDIDIRSRLAGGKPDSSPDNWMKNLH